jgi:ERCC4-type nuclease
MKVQIDNREPEKVQSYLKTRFEEEGCEVEICQLEVGDIVFPEYGYCIERKTVPDFFGSCRSRRLDTQLEQMRQYPHYMILIVGQAGFFVFDKCKIPGPEYFSYYRKFAIQSNCPVVQVDNQTYMWYFLRSLMHHIADLPQVEVYGRRIHSNHKNARIGVLTCIPGIGEKKAEAILDKYGTVYHVMNALASHTFDCEGIGPKILSEMTAVLFNKE